MERPKLMSDEQYIEWLEEVTGSEKVGTSYPDFLNKKQYIERLEGRLGLPVELDVVEVKKAKRGRKR